MAGRSGRTSAYDLAVAGPLRVVVPVQVGHLVAVGQRRVARPHPHEPVPLDDRVAAHPGGEIDRLLRGHEHAAALGVEHEAVVAAGDVVVLDLALRQRHEPVPAGVLERDRPAVAAAVHHELVPGDLAPEQLALQLDVVGGRVPAVARPVGQAERVRDAAHVAVGPAVACRHPLSSLDGVHAT